MDLLRHKPFRSYHIFQLSAQTLPRKYTQPFQSFRLFQLKKKKKKKIPIQEQQSTRNT